MLFWIFVPAIIYVAWAQSAYVVVALFAILALAFIPEALGLARLARMVETSPSELRATTYAGRSQTLRWEEIDEAERFHVNALRAPLPVVYRLVSCRSDGAILFTSQIDRVEELLADIGRHTSVLERLGDAPWWRRFLYGFL